MLETCGRRVVGVVMYQSGRPGLTLFLVMGFALFGPCSLTVTAVNAQGEPAPRISAGVNRSVAGPINTDDEADATVDGKSGATRGNSSESLFTAIAEASGPVVIVTIVIAVMSFYLIALVVWMALHYRTTTALPHELVRDIQILLDQNKYNDAYHRLAEDPSFLARVLASGVRKLPAGLAQAQRAMELANEDVTMEMEHRTTYLATVGTLGPMIGLVGTVYGMIIAFRVIALVGSTPQASQLAAGISTALYSTLEGIAISIPAIFFYALYRNRIARLSLEVGMAAEPLLEQFAPGIRPATPSTAANHSPGPAPQTYPHPFAVSAALAVTSPDAGRPALPTAQP